MKLATQTPIKSRKIGKNVWRKDISGWMIMIPSLVLFAFFVWVPILQSLKLSFYSTQGFNPVAFVGFKNYINVFQDPVFMKALSNTFVYIFWSLVVGFLVPIIMAILLNEVVYFKSLFRVGMYFPNVVPGVATVMMWSLIMTPGGNGILNVFLSKFGVEPHKWLEDPKWTILLIVITMTWKGAGSTALVYLARLQGLNQEHYEAAAMDGAGIWQRIFYITIPGLFSTCKTLFILQIIAVFQVLYEPMVMTGGGPNNASISLMQLNYKYAFQDMKIAQATALSVIIAIILIALTCVYNLLNRNSEE
ncbi:carbohydrate ABC transporter permease [Clostridium folliculivorans]|uniref:ABC transporter n=1 Tax=Clostridium folliculivorans TaxID=2886038 RepID=A0A9W5Y6V5_9CLOT|nr:sugar ABC transporter permease [Clostridium folliculivorans]GKU27665.1 ABC transporter [Clostridium folliculivorans]GKU32428.1 ABC transporter [Clostridium folliculivorans]